MGAVGSLKRLSLGGVGFDVMGDADASKVPGTLNEALPTSGGNVHKITKQVGMVSGVVVDGSDGIANQQLHDFHDDATPFAISYTKADGSVVTGPGRINITSDTSQEGRVEIELIPTRKFELIPT